MSPCPTPEQREAVLTELVGRFAAEAHDLRERVEDVDRVKADLEAEMVGLLDTAITRVLGEWAPDGREARVARRLHVELRLEIRRHFAG